MSKLKLFVWNEFNPCYDNGIAFAVAENEQEAKVMVLEESGNARAEWGKTEVYELGEKIAGSRVGCD